jgi:hypothetical protein
MWAAVVPVSDALLTTAAELRHACRRSAMRSTNRSTPTTCGSLPRCDRLFQPLAALVSPAGDEGAVAKLGDGDGGEEDLVPGHETRPAVRSGSAGVG